MDGEITKSAKVNVNTPEDTEKLSRQQWKNKMKNKRKSKNKYSQNKPQDEVNKAESAAKHNPGEEVKTDSYSSNNNSEKISQTPAKPKERKPQKRKKTEEDIDISCMTETQTLREEKGGKVKKGATESSVSGSKPKAGEPKVEIKDDQQQLPMKRLKPELSKEQSRKREKLRKILHSQESNQRKSPAETKAEPAAPAEEVKQDRSASLRSRMEERLESARFRYINEVLYSTSSSEAKRMFEQDPQSFGLYHRGYTAQVQRWPANPVDAIISYIQHK